MKHDYTETIQGTYDGVKVDFDRYNFLEKTLSTKETSIVISYVEGDEEPLTGDQIAYGSWYDLDITDIQPYLDYLIENNLLKRDLPFSTIGLVKPTFEELADYYNDHPDFNFYFYDGTEEPKNITDLKSLHYEAEHLHGSTDTTAEFREWFIENMIGRERAAEYQRSQPFIETEHELWINPTLNQLQEYNEMKGLDLEDNLEDFKGYDHIIHIETLNVLQKELEDKGYLILNKTEIIETLKDDYEEFNEEDMLFEEWIKPVKLDELQVASKYIIDGDLSFQPIKIEPIIDERYKHGLNIDEKEVKNYFNNIIITKKGIEHTTMIDSDKVSFYSFSDISDYLAIEEFESHDTAHSKISNQNVDVDKPFIEISMVNNEYYVNANTFIIEKDILDYVNNIFEVQGIDFEAKSFDRLTMMKEKMYVRDRNISDNCRER